MQPIGVVIPRGEGKILRNEVAETHSVSGINSFNEVVERQVFASLTNQSCSELLSMLIDGLFASIGTVK